MSTRETGQQAERQAEEYLQAQGYRTISRNYRLKTGEIDLIMERQSLLVFVEVRLRMNTRFGTGADSVTRAKQLKIINTAKGFLQRKGHRWESYRFDVVSIGEQVDWIKGAFTLD